MSRSGASNRLRAVALYTSTAGEWDWGSMGDKDKIGLESEIPAEQDSVGDNDEDYEEEEYSV